MILLCWKDKTASCFNLFLDYINYSLPLVKLSLSMAGTLTYPSQMALLGGGPCLYIFSNVQLLYRDSRWEYYQIAWWTPFAIEHTKKKLSAVIGWNVLSNE